MDQFAEVFSVLILLPICNLVGGPDMVDERQVFAISERFLRTRRRSMVVGSITMVVVFLVIFGYYATKFEPEKMARLALPLVIPLGFVLVVYVLTISFMFRQFRQLKLHLGPDGLVREAGTRSQRIAWSDITKVRVKQNHSGEPRVVEIFTTGRRPLTLFGFEPVDEVVRVVQAKLPPTVQVETKQARLDWENPFVKVVVIAAIVLATAAMYRIEAIYLVFQLALGIMLLAYGPSSRSFPRFRKWEVGLGVLVLVGALVSVCLEVVG